MFDAPESRRHPLAIPNSAPPRAVLLQTSRVCVPSPTGGAMIRGVKGAPGTNLGVTQSACPKRLLRGMDRAGAGVAVGLIIVYQSVIRPHLAGNCKFHPTCSVYAIEALRRYGLLRGAVMAIRRLLHCHPFSRGGPDPVE